MIVCYLSVWCMKRFESRVSCVRVAANREYVSILFSYPSDLFFKKVSKAKKFKLVTIRSDKRWNFIQIDVYDLKSNMKEWFAVSNRQEIDKTAYFFLSFFGNGSDFSCQFEPIEIGLATLLYKCLF